MSTPVSNQPIALDLFAGAGGASDGLAFVGYSVHGLELDEATAEAHRIAGHATDVVDITEADPADYAGLGIDVLWASPPCTAWSKAGRGDAHGDLDIVLTMIDTAAMGVPIRSLYERLKDRSAGLVAEPIRFIRALLPRAVAFEQVPSAKVAWEALKPHLESLGYDVCVGILSSEQYGVPQVRKRAVLVARRDGAKATMPRETHSKYYSRSPERLDDGVLPWVSMAEALGWTGEPAAAGTVLQTPMHARAFDRSVPRAIDQPAPTVAFGRDSAGWRWITPEDKVADQSGEPVDLDWPAKRPSTTVPAARGLVQHPGATANRFNGSKKSRNDGIRVALEEAAALQGFRPGRPFHGTQTAQFKQVGNAVPPPLAAAIARHLRPREARMNAIVWQPAHNEEGDRYSAYSVIWPEAWWSLGPNGDAWSVGLTWFVGTSDQDYFDWSGFATEREARSWALAFQRDYGHYQTAAQAVEASMRS